MKTAIRTRGRNEERDVRAWRFCALRRAGYPDRAAAQLARTRDVDLHAAVGLLAAGCPTETALEILS